ncbi:macrophage mannose receptor 1-like [Bradysia coprophila]|uniref:macrophage mannose receptor 1-like n=1 Tax=Bradysia coprophila TaxID=38358 RepID=UPI00187D95C7|nr:macrophage mannose receptor 1-like [Bradysia coprophila]XP_037037354.1 macrophage mannose receptor 1-like [Bradysia coprophila]
MRMQALCLVTFLICLIAINANQSVPSFLKFIGSYKYNTTDDGKITLKRYYSSHRITYKWTEAFMVCKSSGMRMALIETDDELNNLAAMGRQNGKLFEDKVFVDGYNLTVAEYDPDSDDSDGSENEPCYSMQKYRRGKLEIRHEKCNGKLNKFLCERTEIVDRYYEENRPGDDKIDVRATFFTYIGSFETKKYYASFELKAQSNNVPKICQSFGMQMVSPINQSEYDYLGSVLQKFNDEWNSVSIAGYRSDEKESEWVTSDGQLNYEMVWNRGEPNNHNGAENCVALKNMGLPKMNDIPCDFDFQFVCEYDESLSDVKVPSQIDPMFLKPLTSYKIGSTQKEIFVSLFDVDWTTANLVCRNYGMELYTPSSSTDDETLRKKLIEFADLSNPLHVGITSTGTEDVWYSFHTGKILDFDLEWAFKYANYYPSSDSCVTLRKASDAALRYSYDSVTCTNIMYNFICQKVVEVTEDEPNITSTLPA